VQGRMLTFKFTCYSQQVKSIDASIYGYWITKDYIEEIKKTRNTLNTIKNNPYKILIIKPEVQSEDTLKISFDEPGRSEFSGFNFYKIITETSFNYIGYSFWKPSNIEFEQSKSHKIRLDKNNDLLIATTHSGQNIKYKRIPEFVDEKYMDNLGRIINRILFSDHYLLDNKIVEFKEDGSISGLNDYVSFRVEITYKWDSSLFENNSIEFIDSSAQGKHYSATENLDNRFYFEFDSDTLNLYEIKEIKVNEYRLIKGQLKYKLIKYAP
jgi:hypothetical protein